MEVAHHKAQKATPGAGLTKELEKESFENEVGRNPFTLCLNWDKLVSRETGCRYKEFQK